MTEAPPAAPGADQYPALAFANTTVALPGGVFLDLLGTPATAKRWLTSADLAPPELDLQEMCTARLRALREHTRALLAARVTGQAPLPPALAAVNDALSTAPTAALLHWDPATGPRRVRPHPTTEAVDQALALLAANTADLLTGPDAGRLTACDSPPCTRFLLRHGRRQWCSTRCGDRVRAARAYRRKTG